MSRKHFIALAKMVSELRAESMGAQGMEGWRSLVDSDDLAVRLADFCASENAQFDRARFLRACGIEGGN